ncbi:MAG: hypothetical protein KKG33_00820 [candidate division Zixibacteria bacterium]|nr:hypothetical protein [candidate division Zixibacteria bacterium]
MRLAIGYICALILLLTLSTVAVGKDMPAGESAAPEHIVFLTLHADSTGISLVRARSVEGILKERRDSSQRGEIYYEVESRDGSVLAHGSVNNPLEKRLEYEDPYEPGRLRSKLVSLQETDFVVRIAHRIEIESISFYRIDKSNGKLTVDRGNLLGKIRLNLESEMER